MSDDDPDAVLLNEQVTQVGDTFIVSTRARYVTSHQALGGDHMLVNVHMDVDEMRRLGNALFSALVELEEA